MEEHFNHDQWDMPTRDASQHGDLLMFNERSNWEQEVQSAMYHHSTPDSEKGYLSLGLPRTIRPQKYPDACCLPVAFDKCTAFGKSACGSEKGMHSHCRKHVM